MPFAAARPHGSWRLRRRSLEVGSRTLVMGILNVTPDSFSDGNQWIEVERAVAHGLQMLDEGAAILDIGGESTRPGAEPVRPAEEQDRILPVIEGILRVRPDTVLSVDTYRAETARKAVDAGAEIVNDVSGGLWDTAMLALCAALRCGVILMHTRGRPQEWHSLPALAHDELVSLVRRDLQVRLDAALSAHILPESVALDPGFGFGKAFEENFPLLAGIDQIVALGRPVVAGLSRKGFLRRALGENLSAEALRDATIVGNTSAILGGAHILRVHDVPSALRAAAIADRLLTTPDSQR